ncbi:MAG TPA: sulfate transporter family protein [Xanthobacteraceae bacterium]|nr:sulfate transporter family protein [Xanthobacteraceae bacterium]
MVAAAGKALAQMVSPEFRRLLLKSIGLALILIVVVSIGFYQGLSWLVANGAAWGESHVQAVPQGLWHLLVWMLSIMAGLGIVTGAVFLMPTVTAFVGSFFVDEIADLVERAHYPAEMPGRPLPLWLALWEGLLTALLSLVVYFCALPFVLFAGLGFFILFLANAYLLGREYFDLAAMRFRPPAEAKALRRAQRGQVFLAGMLIALFVMIPVVNLATPLFATALMVHVHKRSSGKRIELIEARG